MQPIVYQKKETYNRDSPNDTELCNLLPSMGRSVGHWSPTAPQESFLHLLPSLSFSMGRNTANFCSTWNHRLQELVFPCCHLTGCVLAQDLKWSSTRQQETLQAMLREELAMVDDQGPGRQRLYWFPCLADFSGASTTMAA